MRNHVPPLLTVKATMITFEGITKTYPGGTTAVSDLDLHVPEGEVVVLVGPSGCGKTTTLRIVNRMIEPTSGKLQIDGRDAMAEPVHELRRRIGYVIQHAGLFPHRTIGDNIATVPKLAGWDKEKVRARVDELMELVGLPTDSADRYPHQLSGGQRQRVGVARALAVDPPIMLMDEPFGAVDPVVRSRLQDEFLRLQRDVHKTIVFVTHDIDEAIKMGDRIAIFNVGGVLEQYDTPENLLANPANEFVEGVLGDEPGLKRLALIPVSAVRADPGPVVRADDGPEDAKRVAVEHGTDFAIVLDAEGTLLGWADVDRLEGVTRMADAELNEPTLTVNASDSLRAALNAMVTGHTGAAIRLSEGRRYEGIVTQEIVAGELP